jgi:hypothetical protein
MTFHSLVDSEVHNECLLHLQKLLNSKHISVCIVEFLSDVLLDTQQIFTVRSMELRISFLAPCNTASILKSIIFQRDTGEIPVSNVGSL